MKTVLKRHVNKMEAKIKEQDMTINEIKAFIKNMLPEKDKIDFLEDLLENDIMQMKDIIMLRDWENYYKKELYILVNEKEKKQIINLVKNMIKKEKEKE